MTENIVYWYTEDDVFEALRERIFTKEVRELFGDADEFRLMVQAFAELTHTEEIIGYLQNEKNIDYIAPILSSVIKSQMADIERNLSEIIFKLAVEVAKQNHIAVCRGELDENTLYRLNDLCCRDVASNNGRVQLENAYRFQNRYDEDGDY